MTKIDIANLVNTLTQKVGSSRLEDIISYLDIKVKPINGRTCYAKYNDKKYIFLDTNLDEELKDFALAHELGHALLHDSELGQNFLIRIKNQRIENEANYFAYQLLGLEIDPAYDYTISQYANLLAVSEDTIKYIMD